MSKPVKTVTEEKITTIRPENLKAIRLLDEWLAVPDDKGNEWWDEFEQDMKTSHRALRGDE